MTKPEKPPVDMATVEVQYRANVLPIRTIAEQHGISAAVIVKWAKKLGWERDLGARIRLKAEAAVNKAAVNKSVNTASHVSEREIVEANAEAITRVRLSHRTDIARGRTLVAKMLAELEDTTDNAELFADLAVLMNQPDANGIDRLNDLYRKVISLTGRVSNLKALSESMKSLIALERQAWGLDLPDKPPGDDLADLSDDELDAKIRARLGAASASGGTGQPVH